MKLILIASFYLLGAIPTIKLKHKTFNNISQSIFTNTGYESKNTLTNCVVYGVVPKGKYWMLWSAENRSTVGLFYYIDGQPIGAIYTGQGCHPYCFKTWLPNGKKLFEGESIGVPGGNGIFYEYTEF